MLAVMFRPSLGWIAGLSSIVGLGLSTLGVACGAGGTPGGSSGAGNASGASGDGMGPGGGGASGSAPVIGGPGSLVNGERPPPGTQLPGIEDYGGSLIGFD